MLIGSILIDLVGNVVDLRCPQAGYDGDAVAEDCERGAFPWCRDAE